MKSYRLNKMTRKRMTNDLSKMIVTVHDLQTFSLHLILLKCEERRRTCGGNITDLWHMLKKGSCHVEGDDV